jgi:hypothetical protein
VRRGEHDAAVATQRSVRVASMVPLPGSATVRLWLLIPATEMFPSPEPTRVVTRLSRLLSAWTMTDCLAPTWTMTLLAPARSMPVKGGS